MPDQHSTEWLAAREAMRDAIHRYCAAIDRGQYQWMEQVFHPDATIQVGPYEGAIGPFVQSLEQRHPTISRAVHMIGNILFDRIGPNLAFTESYCLAIEQVPAADGAGPDQDRVVRLRYADAFRRINRTWKIARRTVIVDHAMAAVPSATVMQFRGPRATRDAMDPAIAMRAALDAEA